MVWKGYFAAEDIALTTLQRQTLITQMQNLGFNNSSSDPSNRNRWRVSLDGSQLIFAAQFNDSILDIDVWKNRLSTLFSVDVALITHTTQTPTFDSIPSLAVTFSYLAVARFRVGLFAGVSATYKQSFIEARAYFLNNKADWESE